MTICILDSRLWCLCVFCPLCAAFMDLWSRSSRCWQRGSVNPVIGRWAQLSSFALLLLVTAYPPAQPTDFPLHTVLQNHKCCHIKNALRWNPLSLQSLQLSHGSNIPVQERVPNKCCYTYCTSHNTLHTAEIVSNFPTIPSLLCALMLH